MSEVALAEKFGHAGALRLVASALAASIRPQRALPFRLWLPRNIVLVDGPRRGEFWAEADAPYLGEIADCLSQEHPCNLVTVRKSQQTGVSILALAWSLYVADVCPDNVLYGVPGIDALQEMNALKLRPLIDAWQEKTGKRVIAPEVQRSGRASTTYKKSFAGGAIDLANANVAMELSGKTVKFGVKDEFSKWQNTSHGDDPDELFFGRFTAFRRQKTYKILELSTPEHDSGDEMGEGPGHCRIDRSFRRSDQRFWTIECTECGERFVQSMVGFQPDRKQPHKSVYACHGCGHLISETERVAAVRAGRFVATAHGPDRHPGFHVDAFCSLMMSYEAIAEDLIKAETNGDSDAGMKGFWNRVLGLPYALRGNAPDHQRLMERREHYPQNMVPPDGLLFAAGADVQHRGIWVEAVAFAEDRQSWCVTAEWLEGATENIDSGAWPLLEEVLQRSFADAYGASRQIEAMAVDAGDGGRTTQVLEWCRRHPRTYAIKGQPGRGVPAINVPKKTSVRKSGHRQKARGAMLWPVGTWTLKGEFTANLHKSGVAAGAEADPPGYCHFGDWLGEEYFKQITAEYFARKLSRGRIVEEWVPLRRENHLLDCRIYAMAMAELLGLSKMTASDWARLRAKRAGNRAPELFDAPSQRIVAAAPALDPAENKAKQDRPKPAAPRVSRSSFLRR